MDGSVVVEPETDDPDGRFRPGSEFATPDGRVLVVRSRRRSNDLLLVRFEDHGDRDAAEALRGAVLTIPAADRRRLGEDEYWPDELVGYEVVDEEGRHLGRVTGVIEGSAQDRLAVATAAGAETEVPFVTALVPRVDVATRRITVRPIPGLMDPSSSTG